MSHHNSSSDFDESHPKTEKVRVKKLNELITKTDQVLEAQHKFEKKISKLSNAVSRLSEEVIALKKESKRRFAQPLLSSVLPKEPFDDPELFSKFELQLRESEFYEDVVRELASFAGKGPHDFIRKTWRRIMRDSVAKSICWTGNGKETKMAAKYLICTAAIRSAFQIVYPNSSLTLVEEITKKYFQYAADRMTKKKAINNPTNISMDTNN